MVQNSNSYKSLTVSGIDTIDVPMDFADYLYEKDVNCEDITFKISYKIWGKDKPATYWEPAEYAELEVGEIEFLTKSDVAKEVMSGLPQEIYDGLLEWIEEGGCNKFNKVLSDAEEVPEPDEDELLYLRHGIEK